MCGFNRNREGDWSDSGVVTNTDRTQQTIELINKIEMLEKKLKIAVDGLEEIITSYRMTPISRAELLLKQIKELEK